MKAVVITVEGVGTSLLGSYGSSTATTPALDRLAARSIVLDQCIVDSYDVLTQLRSLWTGQHAMNANEPIESLWSIWKEFSSRGIATHLITDSEQVADWVQQLSIDSITKIDMESPTEPALDSEECCLMQLFVSAIELLENPEFTGVLWIHSRGLRWPWDAPVDLRLAMIDPEDPAPPEEIHVPSASVDDETDPDWIVGWGQVAAAQVAVLDQAFDAIEQTVAARSDADEWSWLFVALGGTPLGEHGSIGELTKQGYSEEVSAAVFARASNMGPIGTRRSELCQLPDVGITWLAMLNVKHENASTWGCDVCQLNPLARTVEWPLRHSIAWLQDNGTTIRTTAWMMHTSEEGLSQLYAKPDDRWEVNDVASRRDDVVQKLSALVPLLQEASASSKRESLGQLDRVLTSLDR